MPADAATGLSGLSPAETLQFLNTLGWSFAMGFALLLWAVLEKMDRVDHKAAKRAGSDAEATRERLFGRRVVGGEAEEEPASEEGPSGDRECHAGCPCGNGAEED